MCDWKNRYIISWLLIICSIILIAQYDCIFNNSDDIDDSSDNSSNDEVIGCIFAFWLINSMHGNVLETTQIPKNIAANNINNDSPLIVKDNNDNENINDNNKPRTIILIN